MSGIFRGFHFWQPALKLNNTPMAGIMSQMDFKHSTHVYKGAAIHASGTVYTECKYGSQFIIVLFVC